MTSTSQTSCSKHCIDSKKLPFALNGVHLKHIGWQSRDIVLFYEKPQRKTFGGSDTPVLLEGEKMSDWNELVCDIDTLHLHMHLRYMKQSFARTGLHSCLSHTTSL